MARISVKEAGLLARAVEKQQPAVKAALRAAIASADMHPLPAKAWHQHGAATRGVVTRDGEKFHSAAEARRWEQLQQLRLLGQIRNLKRQVRHQLILPNGVPIIMGNRVAVYTSDFEYDLAPDWKHVVEDSKGFMEPKAKFRIAVFEAIYGVQVLITGAAAKAARRRGKGV